MKQWKTPKNIDLELSNTMEEMELGWGQKWICTVCCKTSNKDKNMNNAEHFHKGWCAHHPKNNGEDWNHSLSTVVENTGDIQCVS